MSSSLYNYLFAGLDFLVDRKGNPIFIEANSNPGMSFIYTKLYGQCDPLDALIPLLHSKKQKVVFFLSQERFLLDEKHYRYRYQAFENVFGPEQCFLFVFPERTFRQENFFPTFENGDPISDAIVITPRLDIKKRFSSREDIFVLNPLSVSQIAMDKWQTYELLRTSLKGQTPETFLVHTAQEFQEHVSKMGWNACVVKPRFGSKGRGVAVLSSRTEIEAFDLAPGEWLLQEKISLSLFDNNFWDVRAFVVNGKYVGAIKRVSAHPVVNLSQGGKAERVELELQKKIAPFAELVVQKMEQAVKEKTVD